MSAPEIVQAINLIFTPKGRENRDTWKQIENLYPEAEFHYYEDEDNLNRLIVYSFFRLILSNNLNVSDK
jgi:hypothetical protein